MTKLQAAERRLAFGKSLLSGASADSAMELLVLDLLEKAASLVQGGERALRHLLNLLNSHKKTIRKETCWVISNITAGSADQIQEVIETLTPLPGALEFLDKLRSTHELVILSDTFREFANPLMKQLGYPTLFCHELEVNDDGTISDYCLRIPDHKRNTVQYLQKLNFEVIAGGDSYNDLGMLKTAEHCIFFRPPHSLAANYPEVPIAKEHSDF